MATLRMQRFIPILRYNYKLDDTETARAKRHSDTILDEIRKWEEVTPKDGIWMANERSLRLGLPLPTYEETWNGIGEEKVVVAAGNGQTPDERVESLGGLGLANMELTSPAAPVETTMGPPPPPSPFLTPSKRKENDGLFHKPDASPFSTSKFTSLSSSPTDPTSTKRQYRGRPTNQNLMDSLAEAQRENTSLKFEIAQLKNDLETETRVRADSYTDCMRER